MCVRMGFTCLRDIAQATRIPFDPDPQPDDPVALPRAEFDDACDRLVAPGSHVPARDEAWAHFRGWRVNYEAVAYAVAARLDAPPALWTGPRQAVPRRVDRAPSARRPPTDRPGPRSDPAGPSPSPAPSRPSRTRTRLGRQAAAHGPRSGVPVLDDRLLPLPAEDADRRRPEDQVAGGTRVHAQPAHGQDPQQVGVGHAGHVAGPGPDPGDDPVDPGRPRRGCVSPPGTPSLNRSQSGSVSRMAGGGAPLVVAVVPLEQVRGELGVLQPGQSAVRGPGEGADQDLGEVPGGQAGREGGRLDLAPSGSAGCRSVRCGGGRGSRPSRRGGPGPRVGRRASSVPADHYEYPVRKPSVCAGIPGPGRNGRGEFGVDSGEGPSTRTRRGMTTRTASAKNDGTRHPRPRAAPAARRRVAGSAERPANGRQPQPRVGRRQPRACSCGTSTTTRSPTTTPRPSWPSGWPPATTRPAARWWPPTSAWSCTGPAATRTAAWTCPTSSRRAPSVSCGPSTSSTGSGASASPRTPPGGSARRCSGPSSSTGAPSASPWRWPSATSRSTPPLWELTHQLQRPPTDAELDDATNTTATVRSDLSQAARVVASLDQPAATDSTATLGDLVSTDQSDFEDEVAVDLTLDLVRQAVDRLVRPPARGHPAPVRLRRQRPGVAADDGRAHGHRCPQGAPGRGRGARDPGRQRRPRGRPRGGLSPRSRGRSPVGPPACTQRPPRPSPRPRGTLRPSGVPRGPATAVRVQGAATQGVGLPPAGAHGNVQRTTQTAPSASRCRLDGVDRPAREGA